MDTLQAIRDRRATRAYKAESIDRRIVDRLLQAAVQAPSAMDLEPWAFVLFEGKDRLAGFSNEAKRELLALRGAVTAERARAMLSDPSYDIFYGAPLLIVICATSANSQAAEDCCLAAQNLMLAAHAEGLATCPIGFARHWLNLPATKSRIGIPEDWVPVFPVVLGHPQGSAAPPGRRPAKTLWR